MALKGSLKETSLPDILQLLALGEKTGCLSVTDQQNFGRIYFRAGRIVFASLVNNAEPLGERLLLEGAIDAAALSAAVTEQRLNPERRLGELLVERGAVAVEDLWRVVADQIEGAVYAIFAWKQGFFHFEPEQEPPQGEILVTLDVSSVILKGARRVDEHELIRKRIPHRRLILAQSKPEPQESEGGKAKGKAKTKAKVNASVGTPAPDVASVRDAVDGVRNVSEVLAAAGVEEFRGLKVLYDLLGAGELEVVGEGPPPQEGRNRRDEVRNLGLAFYTAGMLAEAAREFRQMVAMDERDAEAHFQLGLVAFQQQRYAEARQAFRRTVELHPDLPAGYLNLALALEALGHQEDAAKVLHTLEARDPDCLPARLHRAILHYRTGDYAEAMALIDGLELDPDLAPIARFYQAMLHALFWDLRRAGELFESIPPERRTARVLNNLGAVLERGDRLEEARASYLAALEVGGPAALPRKNLADLYYREGKYEAARSSYLLALQEEASMADALNRLGNIALKEGRQVEAISYWERALALDPADEQARSNLALARQEAG
jgi:tetratricopeptide (TPR) repeat protein